MEEKARPRLVRFTVMGRKGVRGTVDAYFSSMGSCVKGTLFQLLAVAFYQVNKLLLGMHA